jgi:hypothetical protein
MKESKEISKLVELNDEELKAVAGGFFNNSFSNFANGGQAPGGNASGTNSVAIGGNAAGGANGSFL